MIRFFSLVLLLWAVLPSAFSQQCTPQILQIETPVENGPTAVSLSLQDPNGFWEVEGLEISLGPNQTYWQETFCLWPGCYTAFLVGNVPLNETNFGVNVAGFGSEVSVVYGDATVLVEICMDDEVVTDCPEEIGYAVAEGCTGVFEIGSFVAGESVAWSFGDGSEPIVGGHFITHEFPGAGLYEVTAVFTSDNCPEGVELVTAIEVSDCGPMPDCELALVSSTMDGMWYFFEALGMPEDATYQWYYNDQPVEGATESTFEGGGDFNPYWWVCVEAVSANCPNGSEACFFNMGQDGCPEELAFEPIGDSGCAYLFSLQTDGAPAVQSTWFVDGLQVETNGGTAFDWAFESDGWHEVVVNYVSLGCPNGVVLTAEVEVEGCATEEPECGLQMEWGMPECNDFLIEAFDYPEGATLWWTLDGEPFDNGTHIVSLVIDDNECHEVVVGYETPDCPMWVSQSVQICPESCGPSCDLTIASESLADGIYLFTAVDNFTGEPVDGDLWWTFGVNGSAVGNPVTWTWGQDAPAVSEVCVWCSDVPEDLACTTFQPTEMGCEDIQLVLTAELAATAAIALEFYITADLMGYDLNPFYIYEALNLLDGVSGDTLTFCAPPACFELIMQPPNLPLEGVEELVLEAINGDLEAIAGVDLLTSAWDAFAFGLAEDCLSSAPALGASPASPLAVFPNPAQDVVRFTTASDAPLRADVVVRDVQGQILHVHPAHPLSAPLSTADWPAGTYFLQVSGEDFATAVVRLIVMR